MGHVHEESRMSIEFFFRIGGMVVFAILGARFGVSTAEDFNLPADANGLVFLLVGALTGLILTPWLTIRPISQIRRVLLRVAVEVLATSLIGLVFGFVISLPLVFTFSLLPGLFGTYLPAAAVLVCGYFGVVIFSARAYDLLNFFRSFLGLGQASIRPFSNTAVLLDTSVIIDGRILELSKTGFLQGRLLVPQFVLNELQNIANSSDPSRRQRGRHGLEVLSKLRQEGLNPLEVIEDNPENIQPVDLKLIEVAKNRDIPLMTNDFNLNGVAGLQGVKILNMNDLSLAIQPILLPGEKVVLQIVSEGREHEQGVGYLKDGTMVVVEGGKHYLDRSINVLITRFIRSSAGRMYFGINSADVKNQPPIPLED
jgi:uncharacterized protein YacL